MVSAKINRIKQKSASFAHSRGTTGNIPVVGRNIEETYRQMLVGAIGYVHPHPATRIACMQTTVSVRLLWLVSVSSAQRATLLLRLRKPKVTRSRFLTSFAGCWRAASSATSATSDTITQHSLPRMRITRDSRREARLT